MLSPQYASSEERVRSKSRISIGSSSGAITTSQSNAIAITWTISPAGSAWSPRTTPLSAKIEVATNEHTATVASPASGLRRASARTLPAGEMMQVVGIALLWDIVCAPLLLPGLMALFERTRSSELAY